MSAALSMPFLEKETIDRRRVKIMVNALEDRLFFRFLTRGSALTRNDRIRKALRKVGYYSVFSPIWTNLEKSVSFVSLSHSRHVPVDGLQPTLWTPLPETMPRPTFTVQIVGNHILLPNEFWAEDRAWLLRNHQPVAICEMVLGWLHDWGIQAQVESSDPVSDVHDITLEARKMRAPILAKLSQKEREVYSHALRDVNELIEKSREDTRLLKCKI